MSGRVSRMLERLRPAPDAPAWLARAGVVVVLPPGAPDPHPRHEAGAVRWVTRVDGLLVAVLGRQVVLVRGGTFDDGRIHDADQVTWIGREGPSPGDVELARPGGIRFARPAGPPLPRPEPAGAAPCAGLVDLVGRRVRLRIRPDAAPASSTPPERDGILVQADEIGAHLLLRLDDTTVAVVHAPLEVRRDGPVVRVRGDLGRVVLDLPGSRRPDVLVERARRAGVSRLTIPAGDGALVIDVNSIHATALPAAAWRA